MPEKKPSILTIDIGTTSCKAVLFSVNGESLDSETRHYQSFFPQPHWAIQNPADWWAAMTACIQALSQRQSDAVRNLASISITGQMHGLVPVDADGEAIAPCLTLRDQRSTEQAQHIHQQLGDHQVYEITGAHLDGSSPAAKMLWLKQRQPEVYRSTYKFLLPKDYVRCKMVGGFATDLVDAAGTLLFDIRERDWSQDLISACGVDREKLPEIIPQTEIAGRLGLETAQYLGLPTGVPVIIGAGDDIEALGAGLITPGTTLEHIGTTGSLTTCVDNVTWDPEMTVDIYPWVNEDLWLIGGATSNAGGALDWAKQAFDARCEAPESIHYQIQTSRDSQLVFLPYLNGERCPIWNPEASAVLFGLKAHHDYQDIIQAVFEGVAFSLRHLMDHIESLTGPTAAILCREITGEDDFTQLRADVYQRDLQVLSINDPTSLGAMLLSCVQIGRFGTLNDAVHHAVSTQKTIRPETHKNHSLQNRYQRYRQLAETFQDLF
jgi:xylulokinase